MKVGFLFEGGLTAVSMGKSPHVYQPGEAVLAARRALAENLEASCPRQKLPLVEAERYSSALSSEVSLKVSSEVSSEVSSSGSSSNSTTISISSFWLSASKISSSFVCSVSP